MSELATALTIISGVYDGMSYARDLKDAVSKDGMEMNWWFVENGIEGESPRTKRNLRNRKIKKAASVGVSIVGNIGSIFTEVNTGDIAKHGVSTASNAVHLHRLSAMALKVRDGGSLRRHLDLLIKLKGVKAGSRGAQLATACIPVPGVSLGGAAVAIGHDVYLHTLKKLLKATAQALHWQAYRELVLLRGSTTGSGPALRIIRELTTLGVGQMHSVEEMNRIVMEPAGWMVVLYKLEQT